MKKILFIFGLLFLSSLVGAATIVRDTYDGSYTFELAKYHSGGTPIKSCHIQSNYESGNCQYLYACYAILPKGATSIDNAFQRECREVTDETGNTTISFTFSPPKGYKLAVTYFITKLDYTYNFATKTWSNTVSLPEKTALEIISLCPEGKMLKGTSCYDAQAFCVNSLGTNMCDNPYQLYMLDYGQGFEPTNYAHMCADREKDKVCDDTVSLICSDINLNGICDESEVQIGTNACIDSQQNWVCDEVETEGTFCRVYYQPVCDANITYPNECFAQAAGITDYVSGECAPIQVEIQCRKDTDCAIPCVGVTASCNNYKCSYMGECNPHILQCSVNADCPNAPCIGVSAQCQITNHTCQYIGTCVKQPETPPSIWSEIAKIWNNFWTWILNLFGW